MPMIRKARTGCWRAAVLSLLLWPAPAAADTALGTETQLPLPRFVSLRSNEINLRTGPGINYPVEWVYHRRGMPVEVVAEYDSWRKIRDWQGTEGWVHQSMLDGRRGALIVGGERILRREPMAGAAGVARLEPGVIVQLKECGAGWCRLESGGYDGWLQRDEFWGAYPGESVE
ncbi:MAG TPA: SH3 domain-containing protein [Dongiaceae bacterium]